MFNMSQKRDWIRRRLDREKKSYWIINFRFHFRLFGSNSTKKNFLNFIFWSLLHALYYVLEEFQHLWKWHEWMFSPIDIDDQK